LTLANALNHLAHLFLSQSNVDLMVGNFVADHVKGKSYQNFSEGIQKGIQMHRFIDSYTDSHPEVMKGKQRLYAKYSKYAAVIIDMYYDHILAKNWSVYSPINLASFANSCYKILNSRLDQMPERSQMVLHYMEKQDWLNAYASMEGMNKAFRGLASRAKFDSKMETAMEDLESQMESFQSEFEVFFPNILSAVDSQFPQSD